MQTGFEKYLLEKTKASSCKEIEVIQSLWSGYGKISRYKLFDSDLKTVVVKCISLSKAENHPKGWNSDFSHQRKVESYQIETNWYEQWNHLSSENCRTPKFIGSYAKGKDQWIILEDLNLDFPVRKVELSLDEVKVVVKWLANSHATFLNKQPKGLWEIGTYWNLETRPEEFEKLTHKELKTKAHLIDEVLNHGEYQTIVHGDAKLVNFCFSEDGTKVAAVDFQYVGGGCGMKDLAYFFGSCLSSDECEELEEELLGYYFGELASKLLDTNINFKELEIEWRALYPYACADFMRFMLGWMPEHGKVNAYSMRKVDEVMKHLLLDKSERK